MNEVSRAAPLSTEGAKAKKKKPRSASMINAKTVKKAIAQQGLDSPRAIKKPSHPFVPPPNKKANSASSLVDLLQEALGKNKTDEMQEVSHFSMASTEIEKAKKKKKRAQSQVNSPAVKKTIYPLENTASDLKKAKKKKKRSKSQIHSSTVKRDAESEKSSLHTHSFVPPPNKKANSDSSLFDLLQEALGNNDASRSLDSLRETSRKCKTKKLTKLDRERQQYYSFIMKTCDVPYSLE